MTRLVSVRDVSNEFLAEQLETARDFVEKLTERPLANEVAQAESIGYWRRRLIQCEEETERRKS